MLSGKCYSISSSLLDFPCPSSLPTHPPVSLYLIHTSSTVVLCSLCLVTLNWGFLFFPFPVWLPLPVITPCLMSTVPTCSTSTCRWRGMMGQRRGGPVACGSSGPQQPRAAPLSWCALVCTIPRAQSPPGLPRTQRRLHSMGTGTSASVQGSWRHPTL